MAGRQHVGPEIARRVEEVGEFDVLVAAHARDGRLAAQVAVGEGIDHLRLEAAFVIQHVMRNIQPRGDGPRIVDVATRAAGALAADGLAVVVELQRHADDVIALARQQRGDNRGIHPARHGDDDPRVGGALRQAKGIERQGHRGPFVKQEP